MSTVNRHPETTMNIKSSPSPVSKFSVVVSHELDMRLRRLASTRKITLSRLVRDLLERAVSQSENISEDPAPTSYTEELRITLRGSLASVVAHLARLLNVSPEATVASVLTRSLPQATEEARNLSRQLQSILEDQSDSLSGG
jgi:hypothetical protein